MKRTLIIIALLWATAAWGGGIDDELRDVSATLGALVGIKCTNSILADKTLHDPDVVFEKIQVCVRVKLASYGITYKPMGKATKPTP